MIEVDVHLVISTFIIDIKLFVAINGVFIPFVSNGALQRDKIQSLKSIVTVSLIFFGPFILPIFKFSGVSFQLTFEKVKLSDSPN